jgi:hypothetical protein
MTVVLPEADARKLAPALADRVDVRFVYADWNDGSELQYLNEYGPFPYGVSPLALGYNYGKRAQVLQNRTGQRPAQFSRSVVDSRPGLELRGWMEEEWERALAAEARAFGAPVMSNRLERMAATAGLPATAQPGGNPADLEEGAVLVPARPRARPRRPGRVHPACEQPDRGLRRMQDYGSHIEGSRPTS